MADKTGETGDSSSAGGGPEDKSPRDPAELAQERISSSQTAAAQRPVKSLAIGESKTLPATTVDSLADSDTLHAADQEISGEAPIVREGGGSSREAALVGQSISGRFTVLEQLGKGGMSEVYLARHEALHKTVAIKLLKEELTGSKAALERFHREAIAAANIGDPHIVDIMDYGFTDEGDAFIVMEHLQGSDLRRALQLDGPFPAGRAVSVARQILRGLKAAHEQGIIHRDLKAENVFLVQREGRDFVKLLDFGISKLHAPKDGSGQSLTSTGMVMGTPQYIAPEQAHAHQDLDHRVDIYALGVIIYEMLTGELPFTGSTALELMMKHVQDEPEPPRKRRPDLAIPVELERVVLKALNKDREDRYSSTDEMLEALPRSDALTGGYSSLSLPPVRQQRPIWPVVAGAIVLLVAVGAYFVLDGFKRGPAEETKTGGGQLVADAALLTTRPARPDARQRSDVAPRIAKPDARAETARAVEIRTTPAGAQILIGKKLQGRGKATLEVKPSSKVILTVRARGHLAKRVTVTHETASPLQVKLRKRKKSGGGDTKSNPY